MKKRSQEIIWELIRQKKLTSRKELIQTTGFSVGTISNAIGQLLEEGFVVEEKNISSKTARELPASGRPVIQLKINPDYAFTAGCEIQAGYIETALVDGCGRMRSGKRFERSEPAGKHLLESLKDAFKDTIRRAPFPDRIKGLGVCLPGSVSYHSGLVVHAPRICDTKNYPLAQLLENQFHLPVIVENSARAGGLAETRMPSCSNFHNIIYLHIGEGIGSAIIIDRHLFRGAHDMGGEVGHIPINGKDESSRCTCGNTGCLESLASCPAMARRAAQLVRQGVHSRFETVLQSVPGKVDFTSLVTAAEEGDKVALIVFEEAVFYLARAIGCLVNLFNPEMVLIGGEIVRAEKFFAESLRSLVKTRAITETTENLQIEFSKQISNAASLGAALLAFERVCGKYGGNGKLKQNSNLSAGKGRRRMP